MVDDTPGAGRGDLVERLSPAECWALLRGTRMGRLALSDPADDPELFPVNFTSRDGRLYIRTAGDSKLRHIRDHPRVVFEVDGNAGDTHWSVLVRGVAGQVTADEEIRRSGVAHLTTATPTPKPFYIRIDPSTISGRRFQEGSEVRRSSAPGTGPIEWKPTDRATRPNPIPHRPPFEE